MEKRNVQMIALWDFSGPEGTPSGMGRGLVKKGATFFATPSRAKALMYSGKAQDLIPIPEPKREGPERTRADGPESFRYEDLTAADVLNKVQDGVFTLNQALELERGRENPRSTLIARLEKLLEG